MIKSVMMVWNFTFKERIAKPICYHYGSEQVYQWHARQAARICCVGSASMTLADPAPGLALDVIGSHT